MVNKTHTFIVTVNQNLTFGYKIQQSIAYLSIKKL